MKAIWNNHVIAQSDDTIYIEGNHYFPPDSIDRTYFENSDLSTHCPWKGDASYYNLIDGDTKEANVAWTYLDPLPSAEQKVKKNIKGYVAFYPQVQVTQ